MTKRIIPFDGPFPLSKAVLYSQKYTLEISGQIGTNVQTKHLEETFEKQTIQCFEHIKLILQEVG
jgi:enamine deaminase RidA (YjgF/YER057c/UK114 family)